MLLICGIEICFMLVNMFINFRLITDPALSLYGCFENAACQVVGTHWKYFLVGGMVSSTKEHIHFGRTRERKRSSLHHSDRQGAGGGKEIEEFYYELWLPIHRISSRGVQSGVVL